MKRAERFFSPKVSITVIISITILILVSAASYLDQIRATDMDTLISIKGHLKLVLYDQQGNVKDQRTIHNLITNAGFDGICEAVSGNYSGAYKYIALGNGTSAAASNNAALENEIARGSGTYSHTAGTKTFTITYSFGPGNGTWAISEAGVFNAASGGTLLCRQTFPVVNKGSADTLQITWTFTLS